jgi:hypothetical protein
VVPGAAWVPAGNVTLPLNPPYAGSAIVSPPATFCVSATVLDAQLDDGQLGVADAVDAGEGVTGGGMTGEVPAPPPPPPQAVTTLATPMRPVTSPTMDD